MCNRIRSVVFFAVAGLDLDFVFAEKMLLFFWSCIYAESNRSWNQDKAISLAMPLIL